MKYIIATSRNWHPDMAKNVSQKVGEACLMFTSPEELTPEKVHSIKPSYIFSPIGLIASRGNL